MINNQKILAGFKNVVNLDIYLVNFIGAGILANSSY